MQLSTKSLKKLIKEEIENFLSEEETEETEDEPTLSGFKFKRDPQAAQAAVEDGFKTNEAKK
jgi:hypothetical protein